MHQLHPLVCKGRFTKQEDAALLKPHGRKRSGQLSGGFHSLCDEIWLPRWPLGARCSACGARLCSRYQGFDWDAVSAHFPTARTAWRCFQRYQRALNNGIVREGWCSEHLQRLRGTVEELGYFVDGRELRSTLTVLARIGSGQSVEQISNVFNRRLVRVGASLKCRDTRLRHG